MAKIPCFGRNHIEQIAILLQNEKTHPELTAYIEEHGFESMCGPTSQAKWSRILGTFEHQQIKHGCSNHLCQFVLHVMEPVRFRGGWQEYQELRAALNEVLAFNGMQLGDDGHFRPVSAARTLTEAQERAGRLRAALVQRGVHADVLAFCREELVQQNYFHAVLEATKSVADKIRRKTGLIDDGAALIDRAFSIKSPWLAINSLRTRSEEDEHTGFANLLKGVFGTFRNPHAHAPRIAWPITEQDALDLLTLVSYLHRRLDSAALVPRPPASSTSP